MGTATVLAVAFAFRCIARVGCSSLHGKARSNQLDICWVRKKDHSGRGRQENEKLEKVFSFVQYVHSVSTLVLDY